jgi:hypothetical protein
MDPLLHHLFRRPQYPLPILVLLLTWTLESLTTPLLNVIAYAHTAEPDIKTNNVNPKSALEPLAVTSVLDQ